MGTCVHKHMPYSYKLLWLKIIVIKADFHGPSSFWNYQALYLRVLYRIAGKFDGENVLAN